EFSCRDVEYAREDALSYERLKSAAACAGHVEGEGLVAEGIQFGPGGGDAVGGDTEHAGRHQRPVILELRATCGEHADERGDAVADHLRRDSVHTGDIDDAWREDEVSLRYVLAGLS